MQEQMPKCPREKDGLCPDVDFGEAHDKLFKKIACEEFEIVRQTAGCIQE